MAPSLNDLRRTFYGASATESVSDAEFDFLQAANAAGIGASQLLQGRELAYAEDGEQRTFDNQTIDYPGLLVGPVTIPAGRTGTAELFLPSCGISASTAAANIMIVDQANATIDDGLATIAGAGAVNNFQTIIVKARLVPGTYNQIKARILETAGVGNFFANYVGGGKARLTVTLN